MNDSKKFGWQITQKQLWLWVILRIGFYFIGKKAANYASQ
jgi:hypothetical protein